MKPHVWVRSDTEMAVVCLDCGAKVGAMAIKMGGYSKACTPPTPTYRLVEVVEGAVRYSKLEVVT